MLLIMFLFTMVKFSQKNSLGKDIIMRVFEADTLLSAAKSNVQPNTKNCAANDEPEKSIPRHG